MRSIVATWRRPSLITSGGVVKNVFQALEDLKSSDHDAYVGVFGELGGIRVNGHMLTSDPDIFAVGDAVEVGKFQLRLAHHLAHHGGERFGMANDDVYRCHACLSIPTAPGYGSLNLAQAVQLIAYDWRCALGGFAVAPRTIHQITPREATPRMTPVANESTFSVQKPPPPTSLLKNDRWCWM